MTERLNKPGELKVTDKGSFKLEEHTDGRRFMVTSLGDRLELPTREVVRAVLEEMDLDFRGKQEVRDRKRHEAFSKDFGMI
jgi:hypothetical protein